MKEVLIIIAVVILLVVVLGSKIEAGKDSVKNWATKNQYEVVNIETHMTIFGTPFNWLNKASNSV